MNVNSIRLLLAGSDANQSTCGGREQQFLSHVQRHRSQAFLEFPNSRANSIRLLTAIPDGPLAIHGLLSSIQAVPAMSRWIQGVSSANSLRKAAAVDAPPQRPPVFCRSAIEERIASRYSSPRGSRHIFSPALSIALLKRL